MTVYGKGEGVDQVLLDAAKAAGWKLPDIASTSKSYAKKPDVRKGDGSGAELAKEAVRKMKADSRYGGSVSEALDREIKLPTPEAETSEVVVDSDPDTPNTPTS